MTKEELADTLLGIVKAAEQLRPFLDVMVDCRDIEPEGLNLAAPAQELLENLDALEEYANELKARAQ